MADKGSCDDQLPGKLVTVAAPHDPIISVAPDYIQEPVAGHGCDGNKQSPWKSFKYELLIYMNYMLLSNYQS